jgi:hypothetical protein
MVGKEGAKQKSGRRPELVNTRVGVSAMALGNNTASIVDLDLLLARRCQFCWRGRRCDRRFQKIVVDARQQKGLLVN